ncbi:hypothetical protein G3A43_08215 [Paraburkholderia aspalathi]|nr:hypothetical protein [Paraburkholderia aspalathi]MBK3780240.1 hypothetical protein [Paraburkholderia aspalathi]
MNIIEIQDAVKKSGTDASIGKVRQRAHRRFFAELLCVHILFSLFFIVSVGLFAWPIQQVTPAVLLGMPAMLLATDALLSLMTVANRRLLSEAPGALEIFKGIEGHPFAQAWVSAVAAQGRQLYAFDVARIQELIKKAEAIGRVAQ